jgi:hypothetical protein
VLGILSLFFPGPIGLPLGIIGLNFAKKAEQIPAQSGLASAGRICSIIGIALSAVTLAFIAVYILFVFGLLALMFGLFAAMAQSLH